MHDLQMAIAMIGRIVIGATFIWIAVDRFLNYRFAKAIWDEKNIPYQHITFPVNLGMLAFGGLCLVVGVVVPLGAILLLISVVSYNYFFHPFWRYSGEQRLEMMRVFRMNLIIIGALLLLI